MQLDGSDTKTISSDHTLAHVFDFDYRENKVVKLKGSGIWSNEWKQRNKMYSISSWLWTNLL